MHGTFCSLIHAHLTMTIFRKEADTMGEVKVPAEALWGATTQRAIENFPVSTRKFPKSFITALAFIKRAAAEANSELGLIERHISEAISTAATEITEGKYLDQFPLDIFQTGSGTSTNMNANEVIANLANLTLKGKIGTWQPVHPNDHVNRCQSSNDVIPSTIHVAAALDIEHRLLPALEKLHSALLKKSKDFDGILKIGRTHLMDAMPVRLGQEFGGWARQVEKGIERVRRTLPALLEIALGGTAVGTGTSSHPDFARKTCAKLTTFTGLTFIPAPNPFESLSSHGPCVEMSGAIKATSASLVRIADDIRLLASGPRLGLSEIRLPALQPGSSMMPGKVNPVIPEAVVQVGTQVIANDIAVTVASQGGHLELNTQLPVIAANLLESIDIVANAASLFADRCITGIEANEETCRKRVEMSLSLATALAPKIGYTRAAEIAKEASRAGRSVREIAKEKGVATEEELNTILDAHAMTRNT